MARKDISDEQVVQAAFDFRHDARRYVNLLPGEKREWLFVNEILAKHTGQPEKVCDRAIERVMDRGFVDSGVTDRTCWPTREGLMLLGWTQSEIHEYEAKLVRGYGRI